jgi:CheY-like chemotaxis protein
MSRVPPLATPSPRGLLGVLSVWLGLQSNETRPSPGTLQPGSAQPHPHFYGRARVLVADDNPVNLMVISELLASRGLVPLLAADGAEAVALACELPFDLILMDLQMPILDGLAATSAIRSFEARHARAAVPVVAYSSASLGPPILASYGLNGSLPKPCEDQELEDCLVQWCPTYRSNPTVRRVAAHQIGRLPAARPASTNVATLR